MSVTVPVLPGAMCLSPGFSDGTGAFESTPGGGDGTPGAVFGSTVPLNPERMGYLPPRAVMTESLQMEPAPYTQPCPWKVIDRFCGGRLDIIMFLKHGAIVNLEADIAGIFYAIGHMALPVSLAQVSVISHSTRDPSFIFTVQVPIQGSRTVDWPKETDSNAQKSNTLEVKVFSIFLITTFGCSKSSIPGTPYLILRMYCPH